MTYPRAKTGLLLVIIGIFGVLLGALFAMMNSVGVSGVGTAAGVISLLSSLCQLVGLIFCAISGSKNFKIAMFIIIGCVVGSIIMLAVGNVYVVGVFGILVAIADLACTFFIIKGCGEVSKSEKVAGLTKLVLILALVNLLFAIISCVFGMVTLANAVIITFSILAFLANVAFNVLFVILLLAAYKTVK